MHSSPKPPNGGPRLFDTGLEVPRAIMEAACLPYLLPWLSLAPRGDGHPVLLLPGFMGADGSLGVLKRYLVHRGYAVQTWGLGRNVGFQQNLAEGIERKLRDMHATHGRKVSLVGWSLGGLYSFYTAARAAECVRSIVTLGSPVTLSEQGSQAARSVLALYRMVTHPEGPDTHLARPDVRRALLEPPPDIPISCLYSHSDGVVPVQEARIDPRSNVHENILVPGSHLGMGFNAWALWIIADRLSQPEHQWTPFSPMQTVAEPFQRWLSPFLKVPPDAAPEP